MLSAIEDVLDDQGFQTKSSIATRTREVAVQLKEWATKDDNKLMFENFSESLISDLNKVFVGTVKSEGSIINRDKLWKNFFALRTTEAFKMKWQDFLDSSLSSQACIPLFYQHITDILFKQLVKSHYQISDEHVMVATVNNHERNALRYAAGYVCRHIRKRIERSNHAFKEELILCLMSLVKDDSDESVGTDEEWTALVDRGYGE